MTGHREGKVIQALLQGIRVKIGKHTFLLCEVSTGEEIDLATLAYDQHGKEHYLRTHMSIAAFVRLVRTMADEEFFVVAGNLTLNEMMVANGSESRHTGKKETAHGER